MRLGSPSPPPSPFVDPDAADAFRVSLRNLEKEFSEPIALVRFAQTVKKNGLLEKENETLYVTLDTIAFHIKTVDDDPIHHDRYLQQLKSLPQSNVEEAMDDWYDHFDSVNDEIEDDVKERDKSALKKFKDERSQYLNELKERRRQQLDRKFDLGGGQLNLRMDLVKSGGDISDVNSNNRAPGSNITARAYKIEAKGNITDVNSGNISTSGGLNLHTTIWGPSSSGYASFRTY